MRAPIKLSENDVERQILDFLRARRWIVTRNHVGTFKSFDGRRVIKMGEKGAADWHAERQVDGQHGRFDVMDIEVKAPGCRPAAHQVTWLQRRNAAGYWAGWFDGLDDFVAWYRMRFVPPE